MRYAVPECDPEQCQWEPRPVSGVEPQDDHRFWAFQYFQPPPLILRKNEGIMSLPCSAIN